MVSIVVCLKPLNNFRVYLLISRTSLVPLPSTDPKAHPCREAACDESSSLIYATRASAVPSKPTTVTPSCRLARRPRKTPWRPAGRGREKPTRVSSHSRHPRDRAHRHCDSDPANSPSRKGADRALPADRKSDGISFSTQRATLPS